MTATHAYYRARAVSAEHHDLVVRRGLLACGILGAALYPLGDILASMRYPGFNYRDQAVSELFAIGAPTSAFIVLFFTVSSTLLLLFAVGIWKSANGRRALRWLAVMMALNAMNALVLWNFFPMHMRGEVPTFTDTMHGLLAIDPFLLVAVVLGAVAFKGRFRVYTITTIVFTTILAIWSISYVPEIIEQLPTPWMGASERAAQYATNLWYVVLAVVLLRQQAVPSRSRTRA